MLILTAAQEKQCHVTRSLYHATLDSHVVALLLRLVLMVVQFIQVHTATAELDCAQMHSRDHI